MRRLATLAILAALTVSSCSSDATSAPGDRPDSATELAAPAVTGAQAPVQSGPDPSTAETVDSAPTSVATSTDVVTEEDLTLFIAAAERTLEGTAQESVVFDDPEIYIALAQISCDRFSAGETFEQIATDLLADIETDAAADETRLVGAVLGAATQTLCPEHADKI